MKKKILILTYYWPPDGGAGVQRWLKFVKYLSKDKYDITIYTAKNGESPNKDESLIKDVPSETEVIKMPIWEPFEYYKKLTNKKGQFNAGFLNEEGNNEKSLFEKLSLFIRANLFIPDAKMFWIAPSVNFLSKYVSENNIDLVISSGPPHSLHIIGRKLKKKTSVKWIADFRDPWTNIDFYKELPTLKVTDAIQKRMEKKTLQQADKVIVIGDEMRKEFIKTYPDTNISIITNGYDTEINKSEGMDDLFTIVHIGSINADRSHESFFKAIHLLLVERPEFNEKLKLKFVGKVDSKARNFIRDNCLEEYCEFISYRPYSEISTIQNSAHILYLPLNNSPNAKGILTGKFFEYLTSKRYILSQGPVDGDLASLIEETKSGDIFAFDDINNLKDKIEELFDNYLSGVYNFDSCNIESYSRKSITHHLEVVVDDVLNR